MGPDLETVDRIASAVDAFGACRLDARRTDAAHRIDPELLAALADLGLFGVTLPERFGGSDLGLRGACRVVSSLARRDRAVATTVGLHLGLGTRGLVAFGSEDQQAAELPALATGERIAAFATTEPEAGSDIASLRTTALYDEGRLRVDGSKVYVTNGGLCDTVTITASTPGLGGKRSHGLVVLHRDDPGVRFGPEEDKLGLRGSSTTSLFLEGVDVPADRLIGSPGHGMEQLAHVLAWGRTVMAAGCAGTAHAAFEATIAHTSTRRQFGRPLCEFDVVRRQLADMAALVFGIDATVDATCDAVDGDALLSWSIAAKVFGSEADWEVCDTAIQLHGGAGYIEETGLPLMLRDARITRIFEGANDVLLVHRGTIEARARRERVDELSNAVADLRDDLARAYGVGLFRRQVDLHRLGKLAVYADVARAAAFAATRGGDRERALAAHLRAQITERARPLVTAGVDMGPIRELVDRLVSEASP